VTCPLHPLQVMVFGVYTFTSVLFFGAVDDPTTAAQDAAHPFPLWRDARKIHVASILATRQWLLGVAAALGLIAAPNLNAAPAPPAPPAGRLP